MISLSVFKALVILTLVWLVAGLVLIGVLVAREL